MSAAVQRLRAEIASDRRVFKQRVAELDVIDLTIDSAPLFAQTAVGLHHGYSALEAIFERIARNIEGSLPTGADWHVALLEAMVLDVPEVRPAVISSDTFYLLRKLLAFRHFFRHAYAISWDADKLRGARAEMLEVAPKIDADLDRWDDYLRKVAE